MKYKLNGLWLDPFPYPYKKDAIECLSEFEDSSVDGVLFDPPYSPRQLKECYQSQGMVLHDTKSSVWADWKNEIARVIRPGGLCLSFGWSSNGLGKNRGFKIIEILMVAHGGNHNDTIVVVEQKEVKSGCDANDDGIPPNNKLLGILPNEL
jgi:DNA modification methylase